MTKIQMKNEALSLMAANKANVKLTKALTELFEAFVATSNRDTVKREKVIMVDKVEFVWCNRHEVYEPSTNFKTESDRKGGTKFQDACILATKHWGELGKGVKTLTDELMIKATAGEDVQEVALKLNEAKATRGGRYSFEANALQYPDLENFIYDEAKFVKEDTV